MIVAVDSIFFRMQAKLLLHSVDAITDPPNSAVNYLVTSVESGDPQLLDDQVTHIQMLTATLQEVAHNALSGSVSGKALH